MRSFLWGVTAVLPLSFFLFAFSASAQDAANDWQWQVLPPKLAYNAHGGFKVATTASIHADAAWINSGSDHYSEEDFRRLRFGLKGQFTENLSFKWVSDFKDDQHQWVDLYAKFHPHAGENGWYVMAGNFKEPFGMEQLQSSNAILFMERAAADALSPGRNFGGTFTRYGRQWSLTAGAFTENIEKGSSDNVNYAMTTRATYAHIPRALPEALVHVALAASYREMDRARFSSKPETGITDFSAVNTGTLENVDSVRLLGLEAAYRWENWLLQSEYQRADVDLATGLGQADSHGWYVQGSWIVTGEKRPYSTQDGAVFGGVRPKQPLNVGQGHWGAWEVGLRTGALDLNDGMVRGGTKRSYTAGVNWYPTGYVRVMGNISKVRIGGNSPTVLDDPLVMGLRLQLAF